MQDVPVFFDAAFEFSELVGADVRFLLRYIRINVRECLRLLYGDLDRSLKLCPDFFGKAKVVRLYLDLLARTDEVYIRAVMIHCEQFEIRIDSVAQID